MRTATHTYHGGPITSSRWADGKECFPSENTLKRSLFSPRFRRAFFTSGLRATVHVEPCPSPQLPDLPSPMVCPRPDFNGLKEDVELQNVWCPALCSTP